jgi:hypothetical protein
VSSRASRCRVDAAKACEEDGPGSERGRGVVFYFLCVDASAIHAEFAAVGVSLKPAEVTFYGMNQLSLSESVGYSICFGESG